MDYRGFIEVTEIDPRLLVQVAYSGSRPQGLGFLHARSGGLDEETINSIIDRSQTERNKGEIHLDYLHGRSMKFHVRVDPDTNKSYIDLDWYDHGREATKHLVRECLLPDVESRIAQAEAGKEEKRLEFEAREMAGAKFLLNKVIELGGELTNDARSPYHKYFTHEEGSPVYEAWAYGRDKSVKSGWLTTDSDWKVFKITDAGRTFVQS